MFKIVDVFVDDMRMTSWQYLTQNDVPINNVEVHDWLGDKSYEISSQDRKVSIRLSKARITDFVQIASSISLNGLRRLDELDLNVDIQISKDKEKDQRHIFYPQSKIIKKPEFNLRFSILTNLN